jgi:transcriptional regulator with XRE-family HTH domain
MADVDALFEEFVARYHAGEEPDALEYLEQAGDEAEALAAMIAALVEAARVPPTTESARTRALEVATVAAVAESDFAAALSALRRQTGDTRARFSRRLAEALGVAHKAAKVKRYYADLENGLLAPTSLQTRVVEALAELLDTSAEVVDAARASGRPRPTVALDASFLRAVPQDAVARTLEERLERDEVDELFLGGP